MSPLEIKTEQQKTKCTLFLETYEIFSWFILEYYGQKVLLELIKYANEQREFALINKLNQIWTELPDSKFNIMENPKGWNEFLNILEL